MSAADTLRKCVALLKQVDFADCAESPELWHQHGLVLQEAEAVLRDGEKQEPNAVFDEFAKLAVGSLAIFNMDAGKELAAEYRKIHEYLSDPAPSLLAPRLPSTPEEVIEFIGPHFNSLDMQGPIADRRITLSVHDLLSAFRNWQDCYSQPVAAPSGDVGQYDDSKKDAERLIFAMQDIDGFGGVAWDKYDYAMHFAYCNGRDEPTKEDELVGLRALIDAAITATKE